MDNTVSTLIGPVPAQGIRTCDQAHQTGKDVSDQIEIATNVGIANAPARFDPTAGPLRARRILADIEQMVARLPTQRTRDQEQEQFQQFSTPPHMAYLAAWAANLSKRDVVLEPSAGTGGLVCFALNAGCTVFANEISERRASLLRQLPVRVFQENAEQIHNILDRNIQPSVVLMNPPFSVAGTRMAGKRVRGAGMDHIEQALLRLRPGGRLVCIIGDALHNPDESGRGMIDSGSWAKLRAKHSVRASIGLARREYYKYGTSFPTRLILIDKVTPEVGQGSVVVSVDKLADAIGYLSNVRNRSELQSVQVNSLFEPRPVVRVRARACVSTAPAQTTRRQINAVEIEIAVRDVVANKVPLKDVVFEPYSPQRLLIPGAMEHPTPLVESAAMASVMPPVPTYRPMLPRELVDNGVLSIAQLEAIVYAGQAHEQFLEPQLIKDSRTGKEQLTRFRAGILVGDGTGLGKGRTAGAIILESFARGQTKAIWISKTPKLINDARRDWVDLGGNADDIIDLSRIPAAETIQASSGILFLTYGLLKSAAKSDTLNENGRRQRGKTRLQQVLDWVGEFFEGVLALDEAHVLKNSLEVKKARGKSKPSQAALAGNDLQAFLPSARVVYLSATSATEVANFAYCGRLGLYGRGTPFPTAESFVAQIESGGMGALELLARDLKMRGRYISRQLSFGAGVEDPKMQVEYERLVHVLSPDQRVIYDKLAEAWQVVLEHFDKALEIICGDKPDGKTKGAAYSAFWGAHQRFFNTLLVALKMPTVLSDVEKQIAAGHACVLQLTNTNEAAMDRQLAKMGEDDDLAMLDLTPRDQLMQLVEHCFPIHQKEQYMEGDSVRYRDVLDSQGNHVINAEAMAMRDELLTELSMVRCPDGPLEMLINHFGPDNVAEVTGRSQRVVRKIVDGIEKTEVEPRSPSKCIAETAEFQSGKRLILVFSDAGGTGASYHASITVENQRRRMHYLVQAGWIADVAVQGFGRTHRSAQVVAPKYLLVSTDLKGERRFISSIARRLDQLGALTRGQRQAAGQGLFSSADNLESEYARQALYQLYRDIYAGRIDDFNLAEFEKATGLKLMDHEGNMKEELPPTTKFLNRILSLKIDDQNRLFGHYQDRIEAKVRAAIESGDFDKGVETIYADSVCKVSENAVFVDAATGAETKHVHLRLKFKSNPWTYEQIMQGGEATHRRRVEFFARNNDNGRVWAFTLASDRTSKDGRVVENYLQIGPLTQHSVERDHIDDNPERWEKLTDHGVIEAEWDKYVAGLPEYSEDDLHLITGAILPIWDRLKGFVRVKRVATDEGERLLGRVIPENELSDTLTRLGATAASTDWKVDDVRKRLLEGTHRFVLANDWVLRPWSYKGERRIKIEGPSWSHMTELRVIGVYLEKIDYAANFCIPVTTEAAADAAISGLLKTRPVNKAIRIAEAT